MTFQVLFHENLLIKVVFEVFLSVYLCDTSRDPIAVGWVPSVCCQLGVALNETLIMNRLFYLTKFGAMFDIVACVLKCFLQFAFKCLTALTNSLLLSLV